MFNYLLVKQGDRKMGSNKLNCKMIKTDIKVSISLRIYGINYQVTLPLYYI